MGDPQKAVIWIAVVGHIKRLEQATALAESLNAELFLDHLTLGPTFGHLNALNWGAGKTGHLIVLEDDAQPVPGFLNLASDWIDRHPEDLTSFYLGTGYLPTKPETVTNAIREADATGADHVTFERLFSAVAYTLPTHRIDGLKLGIKTVADTGLGRQWTMTTRRPIYYTIPSLADHADLPSIANPARPHKSRKAVRIHAGMQ